MGKFDYLFKENIEIEERVKTRKGSSSKMAESEKMVARERMLQKLEKLEEILQLPEKNEVIFLKTKGGFNAVTFLDLIIKLEREVIEYSCATWGTNKDTVTTIRYYLEKKQLKSVNYLTSTFLKRARYIKEYEGLKNLEGVNLILKNSHAKIYLFKTNDNHYSVVGTGNLVNNTKLEAYVITNSKQVYDFYYSEFKD